MADDIQDRSIVADAARDASYASLRLPLVRLGHPVVVQEEEDGRVEVHDRDEVHLETACRLAVGFVAALSCAVDLVAVWQVAVGRHTTGLVRGRS